jgi:HPr kinase/phosphorylase
VTGTSLTVHATSVLLAAACVPFGAYGEGAVLLTGKSGAGKSDVGLRLIAMGARLIADDRTALSVEDGGLIASAPSAIRGRMEIRHLGILGMAAAPPAPVVLAIALDAPAPARLPEEAIYAIPPWLGHCTPVPLLRLVSFEASTPAKIAAAAAAILNGTFVAGALPAASGPFL